jgi:hypothetical protein
MELQPLSEGSRVIPISWSPSMEVRLEMSETMVDNAWMLPVLQTLTTDIASGTSVTTTRTKLGTLTKKEFISQDTLSETD